MNKLTLAVMTSSVLAAFPSSAGVEATLIARYQSGIYGEGATEITDYHKQSGHAYVINGAQNRIDILNLTDLPKQALQNPASSSNLTARTLTIPGSVRLTNGERLALGGANSLAISRDLMAVAVAADNKQQPGAVLFYRLTRSQPVLLKAVRVGALPDMVTFSPDGRTVLVANEGEPGKDYRVDPEGSVSIITITDSEPNNVAITADFRQFESQKAALIKKGFKFASPQGTSLAQDIEPEYITVSQDSKTAWVTLQENNAIAKIDIPNGLVSDIYPLGLKDLGKTGNAIDASDKDGQINIRTWSGVYGLYQPDSVASYTMNGRHYLVTANEGDARDYWFSAKNKQDCLARGGAEFDPEEGCLAYSEETRAANLPLSDSHPQKESLDKTRLGRLKVTTAMGDENGDGRYEKIVAYGGRSFSIWDENGKPVFDSGDQIARMLATRYPETFNTDEAKNKMDSRSDDKGAEPEGLAIGEIDGRVYAFVGLERMGGFVIYDISEPHNARFIDYVVNRDFSVKFEIDDDADPAALSGDYQNAGDLAPEGLKFIDRKHSPSGVALLLVANEVSGTVSVYQLK